MPQFFLSPEYTGTQLSLDLWGRKVFDVQYSFQSINTYTEKKYQVIVAIVIFPQATV